MSTLQEKILSKIHSKWGKECEPKTQSDGSIEISCGRHGCRLDHYMCGDEDCSCEEQEGWCEEAWEEDVVRPIEKDFKEWAKKTFSSKIVENLTPTVDEKGWLRILYIPSQPDSDTQQKEIKKK